MDWNEEIGNINQALDYTEANKIIFNKMPEAINYFGDFCLICEAFRLQLKKYQFTYEDFQ